VKNKRTALLGTKVPSFDNTITTVVIKIESLTSGPRFISQLPTIKIEGVDDLKGYGGEATGLRPVYPVDADCPELTSLYGDWMDLDGSRRDRSHEGVDGGVYGDIVVAPAKGRVLGIWPVTSEIGTDWNLLILHGASELNLTERGVSYYSELDHLAESDITHFRAGQRIKRGDRIGTVRHPGGNTSFRAEVHWEVYELLAEAGDQIVWEGDNGIRQGWWNEEATLVDPLYMMGLNQNDVSEGQVRIIPTTRNIPSTFRGFSYPFVCR